MRAPESRLERIEQIERKLAQHPRGWTKAIGYTLCSAIRILKMIEEVQQMAKCME